MRQRKIPLRKCLGCYESKPKSELIRIVRSPEGEVRVDLSGKSPGRGAYICPNADCLEKTKKSRRLERALEIPVGEEVYLEIERTFKDIER